MTGFDSRHLLLFKPPFDWETLLATFRAHQIPGIERVDDVSYERVVESGGRLGLLRVSQGGAGTNTLELTISNGVEADTAAFVSAVRRMFDLDCDPEQVTRAMSLDGHLSSIWMRHQGLRIARSFDRFEAMVTTVLGQLVSVQFGRMLTGELMESAGRRARHPRTGEPLFLFPAPEELCEVDLAAVRTSEMRRKAIRCLAHLIKSREIAQEGPVEPKRLRNTLCSVPGVGAWTAEYIAMRGFGDDDAFPATDYVLKRELKRYPEAKMKAVRPWRGYAAIALWKSFAASVPNTISGREAS